MNTSDLSKQQAEQLRDTVAPWRTYLLRLARRMEAVGFPAADPLYQRVRKAGDAAQGLWVELHYLSCEGGVGRPAKGE